MITTLKKFRPESKTMLISDLVAMLESVKAEFGNIYVGINKVDAYGNVCFDGVADPIIDGATVEDVGDFVQVLIDHSI